jgi:hypothetical protein
VEVAVVEPVRPGGIDLIGTRQQGLVDLGKLAEAKIEMGRWHRFILRMIIFR